MGAIEWDKWDEPDFRTLTKKLYKEKGYQVEDVHGRLEPGTDLLAEKYDAAGSKVIEKLGIQATLQKADKSRVKDAALALSHKTLNLSYFVLIAVGGPTEDFYPNLRQINQSEKVVLIDGDAFEKELFSNGIFPEKETQRLEQEFYESQLYTDLKEITEVLYKKGYLPELKAESSIQEIGRHKKTVRETLRLLMRGLQEMSASAGEVYSSLMKTNSAKQFDRFVYDFIDGQGRLLRPLTKIRSSLDTLESIPSAMKLLFGSLSATERALLIKGREKTRLFWIFFYFDPEYTLKYGHQIVLLQVYFGLQVRTDEIKTRVERLIRVLEDNKEAESELRKCIERFPMKDSEVDSNGFLIL